MTPTRNQPLPHALLAVFFDMDGTLYHDEVINQRYRQAALDLLVERFSITATEAKARFDEQRKRMTAQNGYKPSITRSLHGLGIDWPDWNREALARLEIEDRLRPDHHLAQGLKSLRSRVKLSVVTNNSGPMTKKTLRYLGLSDCFDDVVSITVSEHMKPDEAIYHCALSRLGLSDKGANCLVVGDRYEIDLLPGENLGMVSRLCQTRVRLMEILDEVERHLQG